MRRFSWAASGALLFAAAAMVATLPGRTQGLGLVTAPLLSDLGLDQERFATLNLVATLAGALFALPAGWLVDRLGVRVVVPLLEFLLGLVVLGFARIESFAALALVLTLSRGLGQSALSIASLATVGKWFPRRVSVAMGVYSLVLGIGFCVAFPLVQAEAEAHGWRAAWSALGYGLLALALVSAVGLRREPRLPAPTEARVESHDGLCSFTLGEALLTPAFWVHALACALFLGVSSGTSLFTELMLAERGLGTDTFRVALATTALVGIAANFAGGWIGARLAPGRLLALAMLFVALSLCAYPAIDTPRQAILWSIGLGLSGGLVTVVFFALFGSLFGPAHLGKIQGVAQALTVIGSALGPLVFAASKERLGSYEPAFLLLVPLVLLAAVCCWFVPAPGQARATRVSGASLS